MEAGQHARDDLLPVPELGVCASSERRGAALGASERLVTLRGRHRPRGAQPLPRVLELAASTVTETTAFDPPGWAAVRPQALPDQARHARPD